MTPARCMAGRLARAMALGGRRSCVRRRRALVRARLRVPVGRLAVAARRGLALERCAQSRHEIRDRLGSGLLRRHDLLAALDLRLEELLDAALDLVGELRRIELVPRELSDQLLRE